MATSVHPSVCLSVNTGLNYNNNNNNNNNYNLIYNAHIVDEISNRRRFSDCSVLTRYMHSRYLWAPLIGGVKYRRVGSMETWLIHTNPVMLVNKSREIDTI